MYSRSAKGGEKGDPNRNPWLAKMTIHMMMPIYCKLFNLILNTGKIPYSIAVKVFPKHDTNVIGLYELGSDTLPLFL
jgi:hypothetical protein